MRRINWTVPTHAKTLSRVLNQNRRSTCIGVFSEDKYDRVKQLAKACPVKAVTTREEAEKLMALGYEFHYRTQEGVDLFRKKVIGID